MNVYAHYAHEGDCPGLDYEGAERRLSAAISLPSVSGCEDPAPFLGLHRLVREGYPAISRLGSIEAIGRSLLVTVPGIDPGLPGVLLLAHLDVVPVSSPDAWERPPFSGHVDEEWIWGRGALDIKGMLVGELEAVEYLLERHGRPRRTVWLAFGHDEETASRGATAIASELAARGAHAAVALDEGVTSFSDGAPYGAPGTVVTDIGLSQKGYLDLEVSAAGRAGHSSKTPSGERASSACVVPWPGSRTHGPSRSSFPLCETLCAPSSPTSRRSRSARLRLTPMPTPRPSPRPTRAAGTSPRS